MSPHSTSRLQSFRYAFRGIGSLIRTETNARIHLIATFAVVALGLLLEISRVEWLAITLAITAVWSSEAFNSAIESVCDAISSEHHPMIERAKDIAAAAVLLAAIGSALVGLIVFGPALLKLIRP